jgi:DinB superfamily
MGRPASLAAGWREAGDRLIAVIEPIDEGPWRLVATPGEWSIGKEAEHAVEGAGYHLWIVRLTIGEKVPSRKPVLERKKMTTALSPAAMVDLVRDRVEDGSRLILGLADAQLDLPTKPPKARPLTLAETIEQTLIAHLDTHRTSIEAKLAAIEG